MPEEKFSYGGFGHAGNASGFDDGVWGDGFAATSSAGTDPLSGVDYGGMTVSPQSMGRIVSTSAPVMLLLPSLGLAVLSLVLSAVLNFGSATATDGSFKIISVLAWLAAGVVGITLLGFYFTENNKRRGAGFYTVIGWKNAVYWLTMALLVGGVVWSALNIAQWMGKL